ncbi:amino acid transporter [Sulfobacillus acidophilus TPY]|uniref:Amino acid/polyamine/organocation transporter, APC superfamily n=1 Tax=Sulfobacillus acidophilus (strain ATCC 700253 / DSM 10332 / NAL) TaxID=679936 RepID=G8TTC6_SULAD|nr:amino acid transporter [Sulfobacillus acidophilus TPY]AEW04506.1 amino acid/polyamine/organocation transporter, APC superfamily [Sulfobacillus acidophilus DSM 10332]
MAHAHSSSLPRNAVNFWHVLAQGLISNGPLASMVAALTAAAGYALGALPLAYLLGGLMVFLWINTPYQFSKRLAGAGGVAYFVHRSLGGRWGYLAGITYAVYYAALLATNIVFFSLLIQSVSQQLGVNVPTALAYPLTVLFVLPSTVLTYLGVRSSLNYGVITAFVEMIMLLVLSGVIIFSPHTVNTTAVYHPALAANGISGLAVGSLVASFGMSGSTAAVYLGAEAKTAHRTIRLALYIASALVVLMFVIVSYSLTVGWGYTHMAQFAQSSIPGLLIVHHYLGLKTELLFVVFVLNSLIGMNVASTIVVSRIMLTFSHSDLWPKGLGHIHPKYQTPTTAILAVSAIAVAAGLLAEAIFGLSNAFLVLILIATMGEFLGHALGNIGLMRFYDRTARFRVFLFGVLPALSLVLILFGVFFTFYPPIVPAVFAPITMFAALIAGYFHYGRHLGQRSDPLRDSVLLRFSSDHPTLAQENEGEDDDEAEPIEMEGT